MIEEFDDLKALANGVNPLTGELIVGDTMLSDPKIIRILYNTYIKIIDMQNRLDIVETQLENACKVKIVKSKPFQLDCNKAEQLIASESPLPLTKIIEKLNALKVEKSRNLKNADVYPFLIEMGILCEDVNEKGNKRMIATPNAEKYGVTIAERRSMSGRLYEVILYDKEGQNLIYNIILKKFGMNQESEKISL